MIGVTAAKSLVVFTTSKQFSSSLGGLRGADRFCQAEADAAGLDGTFVAWLSDSRTDARDRIGNTQSQLPYTLVDGTVIADDFDDLVDGKIDHPIDLDAFGEPIAPDQRRGGGVWTATRPDGSLASRALTCNDWQGRPSFFGRTLFGASKDNSTPRFWTNLGVTRCNNRLRLYCFETDGLN